jgi:hypothetical protein
VCEPDRIKAVINMYVAGGLKAYTIDGLNYDCREPAGIILNEHVRGLVELRGSERFVDRDR